MSLRLDAGVTASESRARATAMLEKVGLAAHVDAYPNQLSGGQKQRVAIARALARRPKIVLADEPTAALDKASGREVVDLLRALAQEEACAILLVTHDVRILDIADRILTLEDGKLSSFAAGIAANTERAFAAFSKMQERGELRRHLRGLPDTEFVQVLGTVTAEFEAFLRTTDVAGSGATRALLHQVVEASALRIREKLRAERATVYLVDRPLNLLRSSVAQTDGEGHLDIRLPMGVGIAGRVAATGDVMNVADPYHHPDFNPEVDRRTGFTTRALLSVPVTGRSGDVVGVLQLVNKQDAAAFTDEDVRGLVEFASELSVIIETCSRMLVMSPGADDAAALQERGPTP
jgi:putative ABC transport system ATP-binding protein